MKSLRRWGSSEKGFQSSLVSHGLGFDVEPLRTLTRVNTEVQQQPVTPPLTLHTYCHTPLNAAYFLPHCCSFSASLLHRLTESKQTHARTRARLERRVDLQHVCGFYGGPAPFLEITGTLSRRLITS